MPSLKPGSPARPIEVSAAKAAPDAARAGAAPDLRALIQQELPALVALRRELHSMPELSNQERWTASRIRDELMSLGIPFKHGVGGGEGIVAYLAATPDSEGRSAFGADSEATDRTAATSRTGPESRSTRAVALRADMDALPIDEQTGLEYASRCPGVMHACGHDGHMTCVLGAARILSKLPHRPNPVTFIFQPAEEDGGGAEKMCEAGALKGGTLDDSSGGLGAPVERMYGLHCWPTIELGKVGSRPGPLMAATDDFIVDVLGVQGHAAQPHMCRDSIVAAAAIVTALQTLASRAAAPHEALVCTVGQFIAGTANNIIPETARLVGTIRTLTPHVRAVACERFFQVVENTAAAHGCKARITWMPGYPVTHNDPRETDRFFGIASEVMGDSNIINIQQPSMGGEDFAYYGQHVPACFFFLGMRHAGADRAPALHQPDFNFNDDAIPAGVELFCRLALAPH